MVSNTKQNIVRTAIIVAITVMMLVAIYKIAWLLLGAITVGVRPRSGFDVASLIEGPAYLISATTAGNWPWIAEFVSVLILVVILARFNPLTISPFQRGLSIDYVFIVAANVVFFSRMTMRRLEKRNA